jgi:hypothetical protein
MAQPLLKDEVHRLIDSLPEGATWDDFKYAMFVREQAELGRRSAREEPLVTTDEVFTEFDLEADD